MKALDVTAQRFGRLVAIRRTEAPARHTQWLFICDCGTEKAVKLDSVRAGRVLSCGCLRKEVTAARSVTHGHSVGRKESKELKSYNHAKARCQNANDAKYPQYGGRGITMCEEWSEDAAQFIADMGPCPNGCTLDRINPHGNYEPGNCRWATSHQQARTRTDNVLVEYQGASMVLKDYADLVGVNYKSLHRRLKYEGNTLEEATAALS